MYPCITPNAAPPPKGYRSKLHHSLVHASRDLLFAVGFDDLHLNADVLDETISESFFFPLVSRSYARDIVLYC